MIGDLVRRVAPVVERKHGGLVNGPHKLCACGRPCGGGHMPTDPAKGPGR